MEKIVYRKLTKAELEIFINMRIAQLTEEYTNTGRSVPEGVDLKTALRDYYQRHMEEGTFVSWLAMDGDKIIGTSGMSFVEKPPYFTCPSGRLGLLSSMYTDPRYRRKGIAQKLLDFCLNNNFESVSLEVRADNSAAINFYLKNGFEKVSTRDKYYGDVDAIMMVKKVI